MPVLCCVCLFFFCTQPSVVFMPYFTVFLMVSSLCLFVFRIIGFAHETLHCACGVPLYCNCVVMIRLTEPRQCFSKLLTWLNTLWCWHSLFICWYVRMKHRHPAVICVNQTFRSMYLEESFSSLANATSGAPALLFKSADCSEIRNEPAALATKFLTNSCEKWYPSVIKCSSNFLCTIWSARRPLWCWTGSCPWIQHCWLLIRTTVTFLWMGWKHVALTSQHSFVLWICLFLYYNFIYAVTIYFIC